MDTYHHQDNVRLESPQEISMYTVLEIPAQDNKATSAHATKPMPVSKETADAMELEQLPADGSEGAAAIETLFSTYAASFPALPRGHQEFNYRELFHPMRMDAVRAQHGPRLDEAKKVAVALLSYYYPEDQGFRVCPTDFPLVKLGGWRTWIYPENCYSAPRRKVTGLVGPLKKNTKPVYSTFGNPWTDNFHRIAPEHITGYVVVSEVEYPDGSKGWVQHTYLAIMMDDLDTFQHWVPETHASSSNVFVSMPRVDILNDAMGVQAGILDGYAILMLGPRIEFYKYHGKPEWEEKDWEYCMGSDWDDPSHAPDADVVIETSCFSRLGNMWAVDVRSGPSAQTFDAVDDLFRSVIGLDVHYRDGYVLPGPRV